MNGNLCSKFTFKEFPLGLSENLKEKLNQTLLPNEKYSFCRCRGSLCNQNYGSRINCYSTPRINEKNEPLFKIDDLHKSKFFSQKNLVTCPERITQCYQYGKKSK